MLCLEPFRTNMRNCDALICASRTSRSNGNGLRSQTFRSSAPAIPLNSAFGRRSRRGSGLMVTIESSMYVPRMRAARVIDFFLHPRDDLYQSWWPGTHFSMHSVNDSVGIGQVVYMDELVGDRRIRSSCVVTDLGPERITWQFRRLVRLPCWLAICIVDDGGGATITHTIRAGYRGRLSRLLDPLLRLYFSARFERMMDEHFRTEFSVLPQILEQVDAATSVKGAQPADYTPRSR